MGSGQGIRCETIEGFRSLWVITFQRKALSLREPDCFSRMFDLLRAKWVRLLPNVRKDLLLIALSFILWGCAGRSPDALRSFILDHPSPNRVLTTPIAQTVMVYQFLLGPTVNPEFLMVSRPDSSPTRTKIRRWRENPADRITDLTLRDVASTGLFYRTVDQFSAMPYRYALEGTVQAIEGKIAQGKGLAILRVEANLIDFEASWTSDKILLNKVYLVEIPSKDPSAGGIAAALNRATEEYSQRLRRDLRSILEKK
jgi:ABC-type uncharacterized transport system auxiliary subunit